MGGGGGVTGTGRVSTTSGTGGETGAASYAGIRTPLSITAKTSSGVGVTVG